MRGIAAVVPTLVLSSIFGVADTKASEFHELVRDLNAAQNRMAAGDVDAERLSLKIMGEIERRLPEVPARQWKIPKNNRAAATYLLSGGSARAMRRIYSAGAFSEESAALIQASLAYAEGSSREAAALLGKIDASAYPYILKGHIMLARGGLLVGADNANAIWLLDQARLLMPRSLVEEAALRREIGIVDPLRSTDKLLHLCERYSDGYRSSPFSGQFWVELARLVSSAPAHFSMHNRATLDSIIQKAPSAIRTDLNFTLLRRLVLSGKIEQATSQLAKATSMPGTLAASRMTLYSALIDILSGRSEDGIRIARAVDPSMLPGEDIEVRDLFLSASAASMPLSDERETRARAPASTDADSPPEIIKVGEEALASSEAVLEKGLRP